MVIPIFFSTFASRKINNKFNEIRKGKRYMAKFELSCKQVVKLRNGNVGIVVCFGDKPSHIIMNNFTNPIGKWDENLESKNHNYDIVEVYDGSKLEDPLDGFKKKKVAELDVLYKREN